MVGITLAREPDATDTKEIAKPLAVILLGPPGSGKGTHAGPLSKYLTVPHISTGDLFRGNIREQTPLGLLAKTYIDKGNLVPDELVLDMFFDRVSKTDCKNGYILDGFPRTIPQAEALDLYLHTRNQTVALYFTLTDEEIIERITGRIACKVCGRPYHKKFAPPQNEMLCECGGSLYQRDDDRGEIVCKRLDIYRKQTQPLIEYYSNKINVLKEINSSNGKEQVLQDVLSVLSTTHLQYSKSY